MTENRVTIDGDNVILSRDDYFALWFFYRQLSELSECVSAAGDDALRADILHACISYFLRIFPNYCNSDD